MSSYRRAYQGLPSTSSKPYNDRVLKSSSLKFIAKSSYQNDYKMPKLDRYGKKETSMDLLLLSVEFYRKRETEGNAALSQGKFTDAIAQYQEILTLAPKEGVIWSNLAKAYVDQLDRSKGLTAARITAVRNELTAAEKLSGNARKTALTTLAAAVTRDATGSIDAAKVKMLATAVTDLSNAR